MAAKGISTRLDRVVTSGALWFLAAFTLLPLLLIVIGSITPVRRPGDRLLGAVQGHGRELPPRLELRSVRHAPEGQRDRHDQHRRRLRDRLDHGRLRARRTTHAVPRVARAALRRRNRRALRGADHPALLPAALVRAHGHLLGVDPAPERALSRVRRLLDARLLPQRPEELSRDRPGSKAHPHGVSCGRSWCRSRGRPSRRWSSSASCGTGTSSCSRS